MSLLGKIEISVSYKTKKDETIEVLLSNSTSGFFEDSLNSNDNLFKSSKGSFISSAIRNEEQTKIVKTNDLITLLYKGLNCA